MNPFLEENRLSFEAGDDNEFDKVYAQKPLVPPMRPSSASKPVAGGEREHMMRSTSDSSVVNGPPSGLRVKSGGGASLGNSMTSLDNSSGPDLFSSSSPSKERNGHSHQHQHHHTQHNHQSSSKDKHSSNSKEKDKGKDKDREQRRKERHERRERAKKKLPLDVIDKLDVTGLFGPGSFHHDGPFDACTPHRNKNNKKAPVAAFPIDGANNSLNAALDPRDKYATEDSIMGRNVDEAYQDYSMGAAATARKSNNTNKTDSPQVTWNPAAKETPIHGDLTMGLGSSTFLDGAPASREAIAQSARENSQAGLGRKKSLVQRLRGNTDARRPSPPARADSDTVMSPVSRTGSAGPSIPQAPAVPSSGGDAKPSGLSGNGLLRRVKSLKVGSRRRGD